MNKVTGGRTLTSMASIPGTPVGPGGPAGPWFLYIIRKYIRMHSWTRPYRPLLFLTLTEVWKHGTGAPAYWADFWSQNSLALHNTRPFRDRCPKLQSKCTRWNNHGSSPQFVQVKWMWACAAGRTLTCTSVASGWKDETERPREAKTKLVLPERSK